MWELFKSWSIFTRSEIFGKTVDQSLWLVLHRFRIESERLGNFEDPIFLGFLRQRLLLDRLAGLVVGRVIRGRSWLWRIGRVSEKLKLNRVENFFVKKRQKKAFRWQTIKYSHDVYHSQYHLLSSFVIILPFNNQMNFQNYNNKTI